MRLQFCNECQKEVEVDDFARCAECGGFVGGQRSEATPEQEQVALVAARAQVTWGHPRDRVIQALVHKGLDRELAEEVYDQVLEEHSVHYKERGKKLMIGGLALAIPAALIMFASGAFGWDSMAAKPLFLVSTLAAMVGGFAVAFGAVSLVTGGREGDALSNR